MNGRPKSTAARIAKPLAIYSWFIVVVFAVFYGWCSVERSHLSDEYSRIREPIFQAFAVLTEHQPKHKKFTYQVPDEIGRIHEITEIVDAVSGRKLRVGDTVAVHRKSIVSFGKAEVLSRIDSNSTAWNPYAFMTVILSIGTGFFLAVAILSTGILFLNKEG